MKNKSKKKILFFIFKFLNKILFQERTIFNNDSKN